MLQTIYTILLGLLTAAFVEVGIATFYKQPESPDYPPSDPTLSPEEQRDRNIEVREQQIAHRGVSDRYYGNFAMLTMGFVIVLLATGLTFANKLGTLADGILLGGILCLTFGVGICFQQKSWPAKFVIVTAGFIIALVLGYLKFAPS